MAVSTIYDVKVRYSVKDKASTGFNRLGKSADRASRSVQGLNRVMRRAAVAAIGFFGARAAKSALIDFNVSLEQAKLSMSGLLQLNMGGSWAANQERANRLVRQFQDDAKKSTATTKDFVDFGSRIAGPITRAGGSMGDLRDITKGAVVAAKAMGEEAGLVSRDIEQALRGALTMRDRFAKALIEAREGLNMPIEQFNRLARQSPQKAIQMLKAAFGTKAIRNMAEEQAKSFAGITSTLKDNFQRMFGRIGLPLMKAISNEFARINKFFDNNADRVTAFVTKASEALVTGFRGVVKVVQLLIDHKDLFLKLATAALVIKGVGMVGGIVGSVGTLVTAVKAVPGALKIASGIFGKAGSGILALLGPWGAAAAGLSAAALALQDWLQEESLRKQRAAAQTAGMTSVFGTFAQRGGRNATAGERAGARSFGVNVETLRARNLRKFATREGILARGEGGRSRLNIAEVVKQFKIGEINKEVANKLLGTRSFKEFQTAAIVHSEKLGKVGDNLALFLQGIAKILRIEERMAGRAVFEDEFSKKLVAKQPGDEKRKHTAPPPVNIKISKIEVASEDPDRFAFNLVRSFQDVANNRSQSLTAAVEG